MPQSEVADTKPMRDENPAYRAILIVIIAILVVLAAIAAYVYFGRTPVPYQGQILSVNVYPIHHDMTQPTTTEGVGGQKETYDEILIFANVSLKNTAKIPLYLRDMWATIDLPDENEKSTAVSQSDFSKVFLAYPETKQYQKPPLARDITLQPGQQVEGMMIFNYQISQKQWESATDISVSLSFVNQNPMVMRLK
ncbi:MAG: hypothetical protein WBD10_10310 [Acidobacteriaceae bacterium]